MTSDILLAFPLSFLPSSLPPFLLFFPPSLPSFLIIYPSFLPSLLLSLNSSQLPHLLCLLKLEGRKSLRNPVGSNKSKYKKQINSCCQMGKGGEGVVRKSTWMCMRGVVWVVWVCTRHALWVREGTWAYSIE